MRTCISASSAVPAPAHLGAGALGRCDYADSYSLPLPPSAPGLDRLATEFFSYSPGWTTALLRLRDQLVGVFGLRTADRDEPPGHSELPLRAGGRIGFFPVLARDTDGARDELLLGLDDEHLDFRVSVLCAPDADGRQRFAVTTVVELHNLLGRLYFAAIKPFHRLIIRGGMRHLADLLESGAISGAGSARS